LEFVFATRGGDPAWVIQNPSTSVGLALLANGGANKIFGTDGSGKPIVTDPTSGGYTINGGTSVPPNRYDTTDSPIAVSFGQLVLGKVPGVGNLEFTLPAITAADVGKSIKFHVIISSIITAGNVDFQCAVADAVDGIGVIGGQVTDFFSFGQNFWCMYEAVVTYYSSPNGYWSIARTSSAPLVNVP
jgi:hypothetical protein